MNERDVRDALATSSEWSKKHTAAATLQAVAAAQSDAEKRYVIDSITVVADAEGTIQIYDSDNNAIDGYFFPFSGPGGIDLKNMFLKQLPLGKGFKYSTTDGGNHSVIIKYHLEQSTR
jgi:hypothetical protein